MPSRTPFFSVEAGVRLHVRLTPNAGKLAVQGVAVNAAGLAQLKVRVTAVPEKGKANGQLIKFLAKSLKLPASSISIVSGETDRNKTLEIGGDAQDLMTRLTTWLNGL